MWTSSDQQWTIYVRAKFVDQLTLKVSDAIQFLNFHAGKNCAKLVSFLSGMNIVKYINPIHNASYIQKFTHQDYQCRALHHMY